MRDEGRETRGEGGLVACSTPRPLTFPRRQKAGEAQPEAHEPAVGLSRAPRPSSLVRQVSGGIQGQLPRAGEDLQVWPPPGFLQIGRRAFHLGQAQRVGDP